MNDIMCFCTSTPDQRYVKRAQAWATHYKKLLPEMDLKIFSDGECEVSFDVAECISLTPVLGRVTTDSFPGWKRSVAQAAKHFLQSNYKYLVHIQSDCKLNENKLKDIQMFSKQPGIYAAKCSNYGFIDTSFMIINDRNSLQQLIQFYSDSANLYQHSCAQRSFLGRLPWNIIGQTIRLQKSSDIQRALNSPDKYISYCQFIWEHPQITIQEL